MTTQSPVPEHAPDQPMKALFASVDAVSVTPESFGNIAEQVGPQSIPAGLLVTVPFPDLFTDSVKGTNVAVTVLPEFIPTLHEPCPVHAPDQPRK